MARGSSGSAAENIAYGYESFEKTLGQWTDNGLLSPLAKLPHDPRAPPMVVSPNLNDPLLLQMLPGLLCGGLCFIRNQVVSSFRRSDISTANAMNLAMRDRIRLTRFPA
jgi:hypothetical protein